MSQSTVIRSETIGIMNGQVGQFNPLLYTDGNDTADYATLTIIAGNIVFRYDGLQPTVGNGHSADAVSYKMLIVRGREACINFRALALADTTMFVTYEIVKRS